MKSFHAKIRRTKMKHQDICPKFNAKETTKKSSAKTAAKKRKNILAVKTQCVKQEAIIDTKYLLGTYSVNQIF